MTKRSEKALRNFESGCNCAQSVLAAFADDFDLSQEHSLLVASGFGGGIGRTQGVCGAVTGACMVLGLMFGHNTSNDRSAKENLYKTVRNFMARFEGENGSVTCRDLIGYDTSTPDGHRLASQSGVFDKVCPALVRNAAAAVEELISGGPVASSKKTPV